MKSKLINLALYEIGWFACVLGAAYGWGGPGAAVAILLTALHVVASDRPRAEAELVAAGGLLGLALESLQLAVGALLYPEGPATAWGLPVWILALWLQFPTLFHHCFAWLSKRYGLGALLGLVGGPLSFLAGERLGAVELTRPLSSSLPVLAAVWAVAIPALVWVADRQLASGARPRYRFAERG